MTQPNDTMSLETPSSEHPPSKIEALKSGEWFFNLIAMSLRAYRKNATAEFFTKKYPRLGPDQVAERLISLAAKQAALVGAGSGAAMTANEAAALVGLGLTTAANVAIGAAAIGADLITCTHIQLKLVVNLAELYGVPLDPEDPEDVFTVLSFFIAGRTTDAVSEAVVSMGRHVAKTSTKAVFSKTRLRLAQRLASKIGVDLLQRNAVRVAVPIASIGIGGGANYFLTKRVGKAALHQMKRRAELMAQAGGEIASNASHPALGATV